MLPVKGEEREQARQNKEKRGRRKWRKDYADQSLSNAEAIVKD